MIYTEYVLTNQIFNRLKVRHMQFMINKTQLITNNKNNNHRLFNYTYKVIWMSDFVIGYDLFVIKWERIIIHFITDFSIRIILYKYTTIY